MTMGRVAHAGRPAGSRAAAALVLAAVAAAPGCFGYHLAGRATTSSFIPDAVRTIAIPVFSNATERPQVELRVSEALISEFVQRGRYRAVPDARGADAILEGAIESFRLDPVRFSSTGRADRYEVTVTARIRLVQASPEKVLWAQNHFVFREQYDVAESPTALTDREIVAIEEIARGFARSVVTSLLEGF